MHPRQLLVAVLLTGPLVGTGAPAQGETAATPTGAEMFVQELGTRTFSVLQDRSAVPKSERIRRLCDLLLKRVDFNHLAKFSMGRRLFRQGTPAMRAEFTRLFAAYVIDMEVEGHSLGLHYRGKFERSMQSATLKERLSSLRRWVKDSPSKPIVEQLLGSG